MATASASLWGANRVNAARISAAASTATTTTPTSATSAWVKVRRERSDFMELPIVNCTLQIEWTICNLQFLVSGISKLVAHAEHGQNMPRVRRVGLDLAAQILDVRVDRAIVAQ